MVNNFHSGNIQYLFAREKGNEIKKEQQKKTGILHNIKTASMYEKKGKRN